MMIWMRRIGVATLALTCSLALAQTKGADAKAAPASVEAQVAARFAEKSGGMKPDKVFRSPGDCTRS
jgi:hypothetical protein